MTPAQRLVAAKYASALAEPAVWTPFGTSLAISVRIFRSQPEEAISLEGFGAKTIASTIIRLRVGDTRDQNRLPRAGDRFVISDGITTQALISFGSPRYFDAKQLEWRIEASHEQV
jgi:hypothetical protein